MKKKSIFLIIFSIFSVTVFGQQMFFHLLSQANLPAFTWTGKGADANWNTAANWSTNAVPGSGNTAHFMGPEACTTNCSPSINLSINIGGMDIQSSYAGTITQGTGFTITVGGSGWTQTGGTFVGSNANITFNGVFNQSGGAFTATSGIMYPKNNFYTTGTFTHNGGTITWQPGCCGNSYIQATNSLNNLNFNGSNSVYNITGTVPVAGNLVLNDSYSSGAGVIANMGVIEVAGNLTISQLGGYDPKGIIRMVGASPTITGVANQWIGTLEIAVSGTASFVGEIGIGRDFNVTSGAVAAGTSTVRFTSTGPGVRTMNVGTLNLYNLFFDMYNSYVNLTGTVNTVGYLKFKDSYSAATNSRMLGGIINASGDVTIQAWPNTGSTTQLNIVGSGTQIVSGTTTASNVGPTTIASTGTVNLVGTIGVVGNYTYTSGTVNAGTSTLVLITAGATTITPGTVSYYNAKFYGNCSSHTLSGTMTVGGSLSLGDYNSGRCGSLNGGTILVSGDVSNYEYGRKGTTLIKLVGSVDQTITGSASALFPAFEIASTGGTVNLSGTVIVTSSYTHTSGSLSAGTSTLQFYEAPGQTNALVPASVSYNNVYFNGGNTTMALTGTMIINGTLTLAGGNAAGNVNGGTLLANGNVVSSGYGMNGSANLTFGGSTATTYNTPVGGRLTGLITVAKTGAGTLTLTSNAPLTASGQSVTVSSGVFNLAGYTLNVNNVLTVSSGATLQCNGGAYTKGSLVNSGTIDCAGYAFNWTGAGANAKWSTAGNWAGGVAPGTSDVAFFKDAYCGVKCNATIAAAISVKGVTLDSAYTGTITQSSGFTITVGTSGWAQSSGAFTGGTSSILMNGSFNLTGGTFTSTSSILMFGANVSANFGASGTFYANGGTVTEAVNDGGNNLTFAGTVNLNNYTISSGCGGTVTQSGTATVNGLMTISSGCSLITNGGTLNVKGNVTATGNGISGTTVLNLSGSVNQTITGTVGGTGLSDIVVASTGGTVTITDQIVPGNFSYTSGTINAAASTLYFKDSNRLLTFTPGNQNYGNVKWYGQCKAGFALSGNLNVTGTLTLTGGCPAILNGGTINATGDIVYAGNGSIGSVRVIANGSNNQAIIGAASNPYAPSLEIASTGGAITVTSGMNFVSGFLYTSGTVDLSGSKILFGEEYNLPNPVNPGNLVFNDVLWATHCQYTISLTGTIIINGTMTSGAGCSTWLSSGKMILYGNASFDFTTNSAVQVEFAGNVSTTVSGAGSVPAGNITVTKTGGAKLTFASNMTFANASQTITLTSGEIDMAGFNFSMKSLSLNGNTVTRSGGTLSVNGSTAAAGTQSLYGGTVAP